MFIGSIPPPLASIVHEHTRHWDVEDVHVMCSGNFTIERVLADRFGLHSNDVSLYTSALGAMLAGQDLPVRLRESQRMRYGWLEGFLEDPVDRVATVMLGTRAFAGVGRANAYYERMEGAYRDQWDRLHGETVMKLQQVKLKLASYTAQDAAEFIDQVPMDGGVCSFPPFYTGGYESLYRGLDALLDWDEPEYAVMDQDGLHELIDRMRERQYWLYGTDHRIDEHEPHLRGIVQVSSRNVPIFVYSSHGSTRWSGPLQTVESFDVPKLGPDNELGGTLGLVRLTAGQMNQLRAQYLDPRIAPSGCDLALAVVVDRTVIGMFGMQHGRFGAGAIYVMSDFPIAPTRYKRLAKLVLMAALSREAQALFERYMSRRFRTVVTTAFTDRPVSMKYRGLFKLTGRKETPHSPHRYQLQYEAPAGQWSLSDALARWKEKHGDA